MEPRRIPGITELPPAAPGMRIGLFGGSFNPAHDGHRLVALQCLKRLALDKVWLLVSPGNPLKDPADLAPLEERVAAARQLMAHPQIEVTGFEAEHGFRYTFDTLSYLKDSTPGARFVWIMGADNLSNFDHWERWRDIAHLMPIAVYARPTSSLRATSSKAAVALKPYRLDERRATDLATHPAPVWVYLHGIMSRQSSSAIRAARKLAASSQI